MVTAAALINDIDRGYVPSQTKRIGCTLNSGVRPTEFHNFLPQGTAAFKRQRNAIYSFPQRIGSDRAVGSRVLPACVSLRNTLRWQSQEAARIYVAESSQFELIE